MKQIIILIILTLFLLSSIRVIFPVNGTVVNAVTGEALENIDINYAVVIEGFRPSYLLRGLSPQGYYGGYIDTQYRGFSTRTDENGKFKIGYNFIPVFSIFEKIKHDKGLYINVSLNLARGQSVDLINKKYSGIYAPPPLPVGSSGKNNFGVIKDKVNIESYFLGNNRKNIEIKIFP
ncbi:hypothetical protein KKB71_02455, partial [Patescibacteria group bacterium]|nr:hypothetical protein [Patescibacteria group bacterium]